MPTRRSTRSGRTTASASSTRRCSVVAMSASPRSRPQRADAGQAVRGARGAGPRRARDAGRRAHHALEFYNYILAIDPDAFAGRTNEIVCAAMEAEGIPAEVQYPPMNRYELFQPSLSRLPVCVELADRLDPADDVVPGRRGRGPAGVGLLHGERLPRRDRAASRTRSRRSRRSSGTPTSCRRRDRRGVSRRRRTAAGDRGSPRAARRAAARPSS